ncbi:F-box protein CPR1-like [Papaver somniferum]|uniref:F-box protein CPR1-like n=1 Tax=Papaver somniferum TaxID=3469 RepID=UPI000E6FB716|nr:F-box protein CPR1-like [Papaver somniferum]
MSSTPEEIYHDILLRLPGKSLVSCKYVCKSWYKLISNPSFIKSHLNLANQRNKYRLMFECDEMNSVNSISYDSLSSSNIYDDAVVVEMDFSSMSSKCSNELLGSCNGLVYGLNNQLELFFLWNPATREYKRLPKSDAYYYYGTFHGLGYDCKSEDYKLVTVRDSYKCFLVEVYSLKSNSWKSFKTIQRYRLGTHYVTYSGVLLNGALHWPGEPGTLVSMNISQEGFEVLELPITHGYDFMSIGVLEGCLCVLSDHVDETFEVWVMQEYGVPESWTKLYAIKFPRREYHSSMVELLASLKNGKILFKNEPIPDVKNSVFLYDPQCRTARQLNITGLNDGEAFSYFESLVSLKPSTLGKRKREESLEI